MKLTKKERNSIYKITLERYRNDGFCFICLEFNNILRDIGYYTFGPDDESLRQDLPEFFKKEPKYWREKSKREGWSNEGGWWKMDNKTSRVKVLNACIRETNPKPKKK